MINERYLESGELIKVGDRVLLDEVHGGLVVMVMFPNTLDASNYSCSDTGGLLIELDVSGLTLLPFGTNEELRKIL
jgi:hypothetical protein